MFTKVLLFAVLVALGECQNKIVGGAPSSPPLYLVSIHHRHEHICAGVVIRPRLVLTAASCIFDYLEEPLEVRHNSPTHNAGGNIYYVKRIVCQGDYNPNGNVNDYAVLEIDGPLTTIITLASTPAATAARLSTYGWGAVHGNNTLSPKLKKVTVTQKIHGECIKELGSFVVGDTIMCTTSAACFGDLGGPLVSTTSSPILYGIVSSNRNCFGQSSVYTDIASVKTDIEKCYNLVK